MEDQTAISKKHLSFDLFEKFNSEFVPCEHCKFCDEKDRFTGAETWVKNLCYKLARNIQYIYDIQHTNPDLKDKRCKELNYWLHEEVTKKLGSNKVSEYGVILSKLHWPWNGIRNSYGDKMADICVTGEIINNFGEDNRKKKMNDYCEYYPIISAELDKEEADCKPYYKYLSESSSIHQEIMKGCKNSDDKLYCPKNGENCMYYPPSYFLNKKACQIIKNPELIKAQAAEERMTCAPCPRCPVGREKVELGSEGDMEYHCATMTGNGTSFDFSDKRAIFLIVFSVWGMFLTLFLFYKSTPLGSWINTFLRKKKLIRDDFNENEFHEFVDDDYNTADSNVENRRYDLIYNPV
ncbi:PIR Superfamily Protein [Plasmodium ovale wallikeri]|uniref:PIR Superfamily Protein n=1 Tax=Plasmodium ovale wallikeri TaxID=864142 RepID=A0A1A9AQZ5_PLAOA|nr:PIR Superfamily Protein [Plasmodium ovale wallikeri]SBT59572.1 PIR Superfamily Protein [Plasmodium ovale wallikeri]